MLVDVGEPFVRIDVVEHHRYDLDGELVQRPALFLGTIAQVGKQLRAKMQWLQQDASQQASAQAAQKPSTHPIAETA